MLIAYVPGPRRKVALLKFSARQSSGSPPQLTEASVGTADVSPRKVAPLKTEYSSPNSQQSTTVKRTGAAVVKSIAFASLGPPTVPVKLVACHPTSEEHTSELQSL